MREWVREIQNMRGTGPSSEAKEWVASRSWKWTSANKKWESQSYGHKEVNSANNPTEQGKGHLPLEPMEGNSALEVTL